MRFRTTRLRDAIVLTLFAGSAGFAFAANAQDSSPSSKTLEKVVVTGSSIPRTDLETASPVQVITAKDLQASGLPTVADYLQRLTSDGAGSIPSTFGNGFASGATGVSLRGLGAGSTLVLLNGRRMASFGLADDGQKVFTDLSTIPMEAVERIEVLKDGASAIYGSDAIAGVVNIILKTDFTGAVAKVSAGVSGNGDGNRYKASLTAGTGDLNKDRYNILFDIEGMKDDAILATDRSDRKWIGTGDLRPWGYSATGSQFLGGAITSGGTAAGSSQTGAVRDPNTLLYHSLPGCAQFSNISQAGGGGGCLWDTAKYRWITPSDRSVSLFVRGTFKVTDSTQLYSEFGYSNKVSKFQTTPSGVSGAWGYPGGAMNASSGAGAVVLGPADPDNPYQGSSARLRYTSWDVGPRVTRTDNDFYRFLVGVKGNWGEWDYDAAYMHSGTDLTSSRWGYLRYSAVRDALTNPNSPFGYWRIGANAGLNNPGIYGYISPTLHATASSQLDSIDAKVTRTLFDLPGGPLGLALGTEYRRTAVSLTPTSYTDQGDVIGLGYSSYKGAQSVAAGYFELDAPVLSNLELSAAGRVDSYKEGATAVTPKFGVKWSVTPWLALRGSFAGGFRAPNPAETNGHLAAFTNASDPVRCPGGKPLPGASQIDCLETIGIITLPNAHLKPERSRSYTGGFVLAPSANTSLTVDYWRIRRTDEINQSTAASAIAAGNVIRSDNNLPGIPNSGTLLAAEGTYINSAATSVRGIDMDFTQRFDLGTYGLLNFDLNATRLISYARQDASGTVQYAGTHGNCDTTNCIGTPRHRAQLSADWDFRNFSLGAIVNYRSAFKNVPQAGAACNSAFADGTDAPAHCRIPSFTTLDLSARYRFADNFEVFGSIQNVTDEIAPLDPVTYGAMNYNPLDSSGAIGRYFTVGAKYKFF
ncbi:TonB-dependent receptor [Dyella flagellata]|uniref:TonB-dependent receptor n=1 Tax=Dyella flagellata TaxID=1867833 RepID=A0ABQ5X4N6_9GAMM|nr:TonB-dependent receptor [Dyella flagellata]GLQ86590.1 TonB-dependent receptor [Dyella flagellata]